MKKIKLGKECKCIHCHWYRPKKNQRCWGFSEGDIEDCMSNEYASFKGRKKVNKKEEVNK